MPTTADQFVTVGEARRRLGISPRLMSRLVANGTIATYRLPVDRRKKLVKVRDLDKLTTPVPGKEQPHS